MRHKWIILGVLLLVGCGPKVGELMEQQKKKINAGELFKNSQCRLYANATRGFCVLDNGLECVYSEKGGVSCNWDKFNAR